MAERWLILSVALCAASCAATGGRQYPELAFQDLDGHAVAPLEVEGARAHVLLFTTVDCPIANGYAPAIGRLAGEYTGAGVRFFLVHVDPAVDAARAREHARDYGYTFPVLLDPEHALVAAVGATVTPEVAVLDGSGELAYLGRIDDWYAALGKKRRRATTSDLADALDAVLDGRPVEVTRAPAVGCLIPD